MKFSKILFQCLAAQSVYAAKWDYNTDNGADWPKLKIMGKDAAGKEVDINECGSTN